MISWITAGAAPAVAPRTRPARRIARDAFEHLFVWLTRARSRRALAELDDRMLRDIGVDRATAAQEARKHFWHA